MLQRRALPSGKTGRIDPSWGHLVWTTSMTSQQCRPVDRPAATHLDARRLLATTSTGDDDVALEVKNAANRNLIHAASSLRGGTHFRSEEHTSELQSRGHLVCRLLLEKKK